VQRLADHYGEAMSDDTTPPQPPEGGSTPPPPPAAPQAPPAYGSTPPPPPPPGPAAYGAPPAGAGGYNAVDAIKYGWEKFAKAPTQLLVPTLIVAVIAIAVEVGLFLVVNATLLSTDCTVTSNANGINFDGCGGPGFLTRLFSYAIIGFVASLFMQALGAGLIKASLDLVDGKQVDAGIVFAYVTKPNVLITAAMVAFGTAVGSFLCYVPGIIVGFLTVFAMFFVVDKDMEPVEAIKASFQLTTSHFGDTVIFYILGALVLIAGAIVCGVGLLAAVPVVLGGAAYTFRRLHDEPVSPVA
jgi:hypothetical protein